MTQQTSTRSAAQAARRSAPRRRTDVPWWAKGAVVFTGVVMIIVGVFEGITGLVGLLANEFYAQTRRYVFEFDATVWGLIHLLFGAALVVAGFAVLGGKAWGRAVGLVLVALSALANFAFIPYYPVWGLVLIALDVVILYSLAIHGRDVKL